MPKQWSSIFIGLMVAAAVCGVPRARAADELPDIKTLADLTGQKPRAADAQWDVRLGIADGGEDAGPWKLIYCLASRKPGAPELPQARPYSEPLKSRLGPVCFTADYRDDRDAGVEDMARMSPGLTLRPPDNAMYCAAFPLAWKGTCHVKVTSFNGKLLASRDIVVDKPRPCYWRELANWVGDPGTNDNQHAVICLDGAAAMPQFDGSTAIVSFDRQWKMLPPEGMAVKGGDNFLPGQVPCSVEHLAWIRSYEDRKKPTDDLPPKVGDLPLRLSIEKDELVIRSGQLEMLDWPDLMLLGRWWVNGKPVEATKCETELMAEQARQINFKRETRISAGIPDGLGDLKAGDRIGLQIMYSPKETVRIPPDSRPDVLLKQAMWSDAEPVPLLSNRIEFPLTPAMLADLQARLKPSAAATRPTNP